MAASILDEHSQVPSAELAKTIIVAQREFHEAMLVQLCAFGEGETTEVDVTEDNATETTRETRTNKIGGGKSGARIAGTALSPHKQAISNARRAHRDKRGLLYKVRPSWSILTVFKS